MSPIYVNGVGDEIPKSLLTTTGDIIAASAASTPARVAAPASGQVLTGQGAGVLPVWAAASVGAVTRAGGNTVEATTTSLTKVDIIAITGLNIAAGVPVVLVFSMRKTSGAAANGYAGLDVNNANTLNWNNSLYSSATNQAEDGYSTLWLGSRATNYQNGVSIESKWHISSGSGVASDRDASLVAGVLPTAAIADIDITGGVSNALITTGIDEVHIYTWAVS